MPIRHEDKALYPDNWTDIRAEVLERSKLASTSGGLDIRPACECEGECGHQHFAGRCEARDGLESLSLNRHVIRLTIAHLDHDPTNNGEPGYRPNLKALCQTCHNRYDAPVRAANRKRRLLKEAGQLNLLD